MDCSMSFVIGQNKYFGFGFTTLNWKLLYASGSALRAHIFGLLVRAHALTPLAWKHARMT